MVVQERTKDIKEWRTKFRRAAGFELVVDADICQNVVQDISGDFLPTFCKIRSLERVVADVKQS